VAAREGGAITNGGDCRVARQQVLVHQDAVRDCEPRLGGEFRIGQHADAD
jgi:hypothetical protein